MARRNRGDEEANMDSLLDALTNVVGILLLVLILTSITMSDVVDRIVSELKPVTPEELQANVLTRDKRLDDKANLKGALEQNRSLEEIMAQKEQLDLQLEMLKTDESVEDLENQMKAIELAIQQEEEKKETQTTENLARNEELRKLREQLAVVMSDTGPEPTVVSLPNPRAAPDNSEPRYVLCVNGKAYWIGDIYDHAFRTRDLIDAAFAELVYSGPENGYYTHGMNTDKKDRDGRSIALKDRDDRYAFRKFRYDAKKLNAYVKANPDKFGTQDVIYNAIVPGGKDTVTLRFTPRESGGATISEFRSSDSSLANQFKRVLSNRNYIMFHVAPDSFDVYIAARDMANAMGGGTGIPNGWSPWPVEEGQALVFTPDVPEAVKLKRETATLNFASEYKVPRDISLAHARTIQPILEKHSQAAADALLKVTDPKIKVAVDRWAKQHEYQVSDVVNHLTNLDPKDLGTEGILVSPQLPLVPHIYTFRSLGKVPTEPLPERKPPPKGEPGGAAPPKKDTLD